MFINKKEKRKIKSINIFAIAIFVVILIVGMYFNTINALNKDLIMKYSENNNIITHQNKKVNFEDNIDFLYFLERNYITPKKIIVKNTNKDIFLVKTLTKWLTSPKYKEERKQQVFIDYNIYLDSGEYLNINKQLIEEGFDQDDINNLKFDTNLYIYDRIEDGRIGYINDSGKVILLKKKN